MPRASFNQTTIAKGQRNAFMQAAAYIAQGGDPAHAYFALRAAQTGEYPTRFAAQYGPRLWALADQAQTPDQMAAILRHCGVPRPA